MKLPGVQRTKFARSVPLDRGAKFFRQPGRLKPRERQMRGKRPLSPRYAKCSHGLFDIGRQSYQIRRSLDAGPENARMFVVRKKAQPAKIERHGLIGAHTGESATNSDEFCFGHFTDEFERHVQILRTHPASSW